MQREHRVAYDLRSSSVECCNYSGHERLALSGHGMANFQTALWSGKEPLPDELRATFLGYNAQYLASPTCDATHYARQIAAIVEIYSNVSD